MASFGGGFGGFGQSNTTQQASSGFGGFGNNTSSNTGGFGSNTTNAFGANNNTTGTGLFGGGGGGAGGSGFGTNTTSGFGSNTSGFGANKPTFGSSATGTGGGLFGGGNNNNTTNTSTGGFGGFGSTATTNNNTFGNSSASLFGANKPATTGFGGSALGTTSGGLFGNNNTNTSSTSAFGSNTGGGFGGAMNNPGIGSNVGDPPGTAIAAFQAYTEKEPNNTTVNAFQNLAFQDAYKKWSPEELRLADYAQGRRHGNASGAGAFGVSSGFGSTGFGSNTNQSSGFGANTNTSSGGLFGGGNNNTNTTGAFGQTNTGGFGNTQSGGLFGPKPATTGFGTATTTQPNTGGSLFGGGGFGNTASNTSNAFGTSNNTSAGNLFGNNANANNQNKPGGGFGFGTATTNTPTAFGTNPTNNAFGAANNPQGTAGGLFGNANTNQPAATGLFTNNQQSTGAGFGGGSGFGTQNQQQQQQQQQPNTGGIFGNPAAKPAGSLFGTTNTGTQGSLFGGANTASTNTPGFGATNTAPTGGIFGGAKPATATSSLFNTAPNQNPGGGGGMFGNLTNNQPQQQQQGTNATLFGAMGQNNAQQKTMFGASTQAAAPGMFGASTIQPQGLLFNNQQPQQGSTFGNSLLGATQNSMAAPQGLTASLTDISAYGSSSLFANLGGSVASNPGPLATPLSKSTQRRSSVLPMYKLNPASASRMVTPQKRGFGLSVGTPSSGTSATSAPGNLGRSLLGPAASRNLSKSVSSNSLRRTFNAEDSILAPGAFSSSTSSRFLTNGSGGGKKLVINRDMRSDLFSPSKDKTPDVGNARKLSKRVSFETEGESSEPIGLLTNGAEGHDYTPTRMSSNLPNSETPDGEGKGKELTSVPEEDVAGASQSGFQPGPYEIEPAWDEIRKMSPAERAAVPNFRISRQNVASIAFQCPVDLTNLTYDDLCGNIIQLEHRKATVYPPGTSKPPRGQGLNVPADIVIYQAWPRNPATPSKDHARKLAKMPGTTFKSYDSDTGAWEFSVAHFTTYGVDESDATDDEYEEDDEDIPRPRTTDIPMAGGHPEDDTLASRKSSRLPGAFDMESAPAPAQSDRQRRESFLGSSSAGSPSNGMRLLDDYPSHMDDEYDMSENEGLTRHSFRQHHAAEQDDFSSDGEGEKTQAMPVSILRARARAQKEAAGPVELQVADRNDWMEMLRKTVSPVKGDRQALRAIQDMLDEDGAGDTGSPASRFGASINAKGPTFEDRMHDIASPAKPGRKREFGASRRLGAVPDPNEGRGFSNSIDLMRSLFEDARTASPTRRATVASPAKGFVKWPYERQDKTEGGELDEIETAFRQAIKPSWGPQGTIIYAAKPSSSLHQATGSFSHVLASTSQQELLVGQLSGEIKTSPAMLQTHMRLSTITASSHSYVVNGERRHEIIPSVQLHMPTLLDFSQSLDGDSASVAHERLVWELASILFDREALGDGRRGKTEQQARKAKLSQFWKSQVHRAATTAANLASNDEEKAVAYLSGNLVPEACKHLLEGKDFHLATLVSLIGTTEQGKESIHEQLESWRQSEILSEISQPIRAIYEMLGGNVCFCDGVQGVPIEHRVAQFTISERFGLDWRRAFGLRLWYAIAKEDDLSAAVAKFRADIAAGNEKLPQPWYREQGISTLWEDKNVDGRQDLLWGLLQLYAEPRLDLQSILRPENSQLSPLDSRLSWQLGIALMSTGKVSFGTHAAEKMDASTLSFASQLVNEGDWVSAVFVLLHLSDPVARLRAIQDLLGRHAGSIGSETSDTFKALANDFKIPSTWIWEAQSLFMRSVRKDHAGEVQCLLRAGAFTEAHRVLVDHVAPAAIVEQDYESLSTLVSPFRGREGSISDWGTGGEIYDTFLEFAKHRSRGQPVPSTILGKLISGLPAMEGRLETGKSRDYVKHAAVTCMADEVAKAVIENKELRGKIQDLPLTSDRRLHYSMNQSWDCFPRQPLMS